MATVVCVKRGLESNSFDVLEVVDGQQRLITLIILLNAIKLALDPEKDEEKDTHRLLTELLVKDVGDEKLLLLNTNHDGNEYFANYLKEGIEEPARVANTLADREVLSAVNECKKFVKDWRQKHGELISLFNRVMDKLVFILHELEEESVVYTIFEALNTRGLEVSWFDRLKNILVGTTHRSGGGDEGIRRLRDVWARIYGLIGTQAALGTEAFRFTATLYAEKMLARIPGEEQSVRDLRGQAPDAAKSLELSRRLESVTQACCELQRRGELKAVTRIGHSRLLGVAILLREDLDESDREILLEAWEKVTFRIFGMLREEAARHRTQYIGLAWQIFNRDRGVEGRELEEIWKLAQPFNLNKAIERTATSDCYNGWEFYLRRLFYRYERHLADESGREILAQWEEIWSTSSIHHIWFNSEHKSDFTNNLGNLIVLPPTLSADLAGLEPGEKEERLRASVLRTAKRAADFISNNSTPEAAIAARREEILN